MNGLFRASSAFLCAAIALFLAVPVKADEPSPSVAEQVEGLRRTLEILVPGPVLSEATPPKVDLKILVTGAQWAWGYRYVAANGEPVDMKELVVPVGQVTQIDVTSTDIIHQFSVPALGIDVEGIPGRIETVWLKPSKTGTFFGQCSSLCGSGYADMVISINVVSPDEYGIWIAGRLD